MSIDLIKQLREETGVSVMECKKALEKANNDIEQAKIILKEEGLVNASKKSSRETKNGVIVSCVSPDGKNGAILELRCETDFVAKNEEFIQLANNLVKEILNQRPTDTTDLLAKTKESETISDVIKGTIAKFGENIEIGQFNLLDTINGIIVSYIHNGNKVGVLLQLDCANGIDINNDSIKQLGKDIAMQIAAMNPQFVKAEDIPSDKLEFYKKEFEQDIDMSKPEDIRNKILEGKFTKKYEDICLLNQHFIKDDTKTIGDLLKAFNTQNNINITIAKFIRYQI